jgi:hypothetical protein
MITEYIVSLYAAGERIAGDCLPQFFMSHAAAYAAGAEEVARVAAIEPSDRHPQMDWAVRFTVRAVRNPKAFAKGI